MWLYTSRIQHLLQISLTQGNTLAVNLTYINESLETLDFEISNFQNSSVSYIKIILNIYMCIASRCVVIYCISYIILYLSLSCTCSNTLSLALWCQLDFRKGSISPVLITSLSREKTVYCQLDFPHQLRMTRFRTSPDGDTQRWIMDILTT